MSGLHPGRPALVLALARAHATRARRSDDFGGLVAPTTFGEPSRGGAAGVRMETWW